MSLTLQHASTTQSLADWGFEDVQTREINQQMGELTASIAGDMLAALPWGHEDAVILRRDDAVIWRGVALPPTRSGTGDEESITVRFGDAWYWLTQGEYRQSVWNAATGAAIEVAHPALFAKITAGVDWVLTTIGDQIIGIIAQCDARHGGGKMQLGTLGGTGFAQYAPATQSNGGTYEDALRRCLDLVPDACTQWDHSTSPPTLHIYQRAAAPVRTFAFADGALQVSQDIIKRDDLVVSGAAIIYVKRGPLGKYGATDAAGDMSSPSAVTVMVDYTELDGGDGEDAITEVAPIIEKQELVSEAVSHMSAAWWAKYGGCGAEEADITVGDGSNIALAVGAPENAEVGGLGGKTRWLLKGQVPAWMNQSAHFCVAQVTGYLRVKVRDVVDSEERGYHVEDRKVTMLLPCTDLGSNVYTRTVQVGYTPPDVGGGAWQIPPTGLAAAWLAALSVAPHEGQITWTERECSLAVRPGDVLNLTGGDELWEDMVAQVQTVARRYDGGDTIVTFGPPKHLNLDDFARQATRMSIKPAMDMQRRAAGAADSGPDMTTEREVNHPAGSSVRGQSDGGVLVERWISREGYLYKEKMDEEEVTQTAKDPEENEYELKPDKLTFRDAGGAELEISAAGIKITKEGKTVTLDIDQLLIEDGGKSATLDIGKLSLDDGEGKTTLLDLDQLALDDGAKQSTLTRGALSLENGAQTVELDSDIGVTVTASTGSTVLGPVQILITEGGLTNSVSSEQMVITGSGKLGTYEANALTVSASGSEAGASAADGLTHTDGSDTAELSVTHLQILQASDSVVVSPELGMAASHSGGQASIGPAGGVELDIGGGTVIIQPVSGKEVTLLETEGCGDDGEPTMAHVLRSEEEAA